MVEESWLCPELTLHPCWRMFCVCVWLYLPVCVGGSVCGKSLAALVTSYSASHTHTVGAWQQNGRRQTVCSWRCVFPSTPFWGQVCNGPVWRETHRPSSSLISRSPDTPEPSLSLPFLSNQSLISRPVRN